MNFSLLIQGYRVKNAGNKNIDISKPKDSNNILSLNKKNETPSEIENSITSIIFGHFI